MIEREFEDYLALLRGLLRLRKTQCDAIADELRDHMDARLEDLLAEGIPKEKAVQIALEEFGDAAGVGQAFLELNRNNQRRWNMRITAASLLTCTALGLAAMAFWPDSANHLSAPVMAQVGGGGPGPGGEIAGMPPQRERTREENNQETAAKLTKIQERFEIDHITLTDLAPQVGEMCNVNVILDTQKLSESGVDTSGALTLSLKNVRVDTALELALSQVQAGYYIHDGIVIITTKEALAAVTEVRVYNVADLVYLDTPWPLEPSRGHGGMPGGSGMMGPAGSGAGMMPGAPGTGGNSYGGGNPYGGRGGPPGGMGGPPGGIGGPPGGLGGVGGGPPGGFGGPPGGIGGPPGGIGVPGGSEGGSPPGRSGDAGPAPAGRGGPGGPGVGRPGSGGIPGSAPGSLGGSTSEEGGGSLNSSGSPDVTPTGGETGLDRRASSNVRGWIGNVLAQVGGVGMSGPGGGMAAGGGSGGPPAAMSGGGMGGMGGHRSTPEERRTSDLIAAITSAVETNSWSDNGADGEGEIRPFEGLLIVRNTPKAHQGVEILLQQIRAARHTPRGMMGGGMGGMGGGMMGGGGQFGSGMSGGFGGGS